MTGIKTVAQIEAELGRCERLAAKPMPQSRYNLLAVRIDTLKWMLGHPDARPW